VLEFVERRGGCGGLVFLVAHNGKKFDVPFLVKEFQRCSMQIPYWWRFVDTMPIARLAMKAKGKPYWPQFIETMVFDYSIGISRYLRLGNKIIYQHACSNLFNVFVDMEDQY
jgi:DNA polymerase III epsilon subunit-like protein